MIVFFIMGLMLMYGLLALGQTQFFISDIKQDIRFMEPGYLHKASPFQQIHP